MPDHALLDQLLNSFPKSNKEDWSRAASKEISQINPLQHLTWKSDEEIVFLPYYDPDDVASLQYLNQFQRTSVKTSLDARAWISLPLISPGPNKNANAVALNHLANGADGVLFDVRETTDVDLESLLSEIHWPSCNVSFLATHTTNLVQHITHFAAKKKIAPDLLTGTIFCNSRHDNLNISDYLLPYSQLRALGIYIQPSNAVNEIAAALIAATSLMDEHTNAGRPKDFVWSNLSFSLPNGKNFLLDIAKQKALRLLLYQIGRAFELSEYKEVEINVRVEAWNNDKFQPHGNMISNTVAAVAAITGGCDSLTVLPEDENNETMSRIARNVCNILREESHLNRVADPIAGAYAIESMVNELAATAWKNFQHHIVQL